MLPPSTPLVVYVSDDRWSPSQFRWQRFPPTESIGLNGEGQRAREHAIDLVAEDTKIVRGTAIPPRSSKKKVAQFSAAVLFGTGSDCRAVVRHSSISKNLVHTDDVRIKRQVDISLRHRRYSSPQIKVPCVRFGQYTLTARVG